MTLLVPHGHERLRPTAMVQQDDSELVYAMARGDRAALAALYDRHAAYLLAFSRQILRDANDAEDLLHDVFVESFAHAGDYDPARGNVLSWLVVRTRSRCLDRLRRRRPAADRDVDDWALAQECPVRELEHTELRTWIGTLRESQRQVLFLAYFGGLSSSEIAARLEVPVGTVKSRIRHALSELRSALTSRESRDGADAISSSSSAAVRRQEEREG